MSQSEKTTEGLHKTRRPLLAFSAGLLIYVLADVSLSELIGLSTSYPYIVDSAAYLLLYYHALRYHFEYRNHRYAFYSEWCSSLLDRDSAFWASRQRLFSLQEPITNIEFSRTPAVVSSFFDFSFWYQVTIVTSAGSEVRKVNGMTFFHIVKQQILKASTRPTFIDTHFAWWLFWIAIFVQVTGPYS